MRNTVTYRTAWTTCFATICGIARYKFKSGDNSGSIIATTPAVYDGFNY